MTSPSSTKTGQQPETVADVELDDVEDAGLMDTPVGGWGVLADDTQAQQSVSNVLKNRTQSAGNSIRNTN